MDAVDTRALGRLRAARHEGGAEGPARNPGPGRAGATRVKTSAKPSRGAAPKAVLRRGEPGRTVRGPSPDEPTPSRPTTRSPTPGSSDQNRSNAWRLLRTCSRTATLADIRCAGCPAAAGPCAAGPAARGPSPARRRGQRRTRPCACAGRRPSAARPRPPTCRRPGGTARPHRPPDASPGPARTPVPTPASPRRPVRAGPPEKAPAEDDGRLCHIPERDMAADVATVRPLDDGPDLPSRPLTCRFVCSPVWT